MYKKECNCKKKIYLRRDKIYLQKIRPTNYLRKEKKIYLRTKSTNKIMTKQKKLLTKNKIILQNKKSTYGKTDKNLFTKQKIYLRNKKNIFTKKHTKIYLRKTHKNYLQKNKKNKTTYKTKTYTSEKNLLPKKSTHTQKQTNKLLTKILIPYKVTLLHTGLTSPTSADTCGRGVHRLPFSRAFSRKGTRL